MLNIGGIFMKSNIDNIKIIKEGEVSKALLTLGIPIIIGMLINCSYNVIDAYFTSTLGINEVGAISVTIPLTMAISGIGIGIGAGAGSYISRLLGKQDAHRANITASTAVCSSIITGIIVSIILIIFLDKILLAIGATETILPFAKDYGAICSCFGVLPLFNVTMNNIMVAQGAGKISMTAMIIGAIANTILAPIFIF